MFEEYGGGRDPGLQVSGAHSFAGLGSKELAKDLRHVDPQKALCACVCEGEECRGVPEGAASPASSRELLAVLLWPFMSGLSRDWALTLVPGDGNSLCWPKFPRLPGSQAQPDLGSRQDWARGQLSTLALSWAWGVRELSESHSIPIHAIVPGVGTWGPGCGTALLSLAICPLLLSLPFLQFPKAYPANLPLQLGLPSLPPRSWFGQASLCLPVFTGR